MCNCSNFWVKTRRAISYLSGLVVATILTFYMMNVRFAHRADELRTAQAIADDIPVLELPSIDPCPPRKSNHAQILPGSGLPGGGLRAQGQGLVLLSPSKWWALAPLGCEALENQGLTVVFRNAHTRTS